MSLYNMLFGNNILTPMLLAIIDMETSEIPRFRDCYWDGEKIVVYTRTGGGNREEYFNENNILASDPNYIGDEDDYYDNTYAKFYYLLPAKFEHLRSWLDENVASDPGARWAELIEKLDANDDSDPVVQKALSAGKELAGRIKGELNK